VALPSSVTKIREQPDFFRTEFHGPTCLFLGGHRARKRRFDDGRRSRVTLFRPAERETPLFDPQCTFGLALAQSLALYKDVENA